MVSKNFERWRALAARKEMRPAWLVLAVSLAATLIFWQLARTVEWQSKDLRLKALATEVSTETNRRMTAYRQMLRAGAGVFATRLDVTRNDWHNFVSELNLPEFYPGTLGLGYSTMVSPNELAGHEKAFRSIYGESYLVRPAGSREIYSAIVFLEPENWRNQKAIGYDMFSEATRRSAMERAVATGRVALSGKIKLVQEMDSGVQPGVLLYFSVFRTPSPGVTSFDRMQNLKGFVYAPLRMHDFMSDVIKTALPAVPALMRIEVFDGQSNEAEASLYDSAPRLDPIDPASRFTTLIDYEFNGRTWTIRATSTPAFESHVVSRNPDLILAVGLVSNWLLWALASSMAMRRIEDTEAAAQMAVLTRELSHRVKNTLAIVQSIANRSLSNDRSLKEGREVFLKRLHALARAHTILLENSWRGVDLRQLVSAELAVFGARATIRGPDIALPPQLAQSLTLVVHELATNALKYGALSNDDGQVVVDWDFISQSTDRLRFTWKELGGPKVEPPSRSGFGQVLLRQTIGAGETAEPIVEFRPDGIFYELEMVIGETTELEPVPQA